MTSGTNVVHSFDEPGEYIVNLSVVDDNGCVSLNLQPLQVLVSTIPLFNSVQSTPVCAGSPAFVDGNPVQSVTWTALPPQVVAGETYLADGAGFSYTSELNFDFFEDGATLDDCDDLLAVTVNMEHSYLGDLDLSISCPDGTTVSLMSYPNGGGGTFFGEAVDFGSGSNVPGSDTTTAGRPTRNSTPTSTPTAIPPRPPSPTTKASKARPTSSTLASTRRRATCATSRGAR